MFIFWKYFWNFILISALIVLFQNGETLQLYGKDKFVHKGIKGKELTLNCTASGDSALEINWRKTDGKNLTTLGIVEKIINKNTLLLIFQEFDEEQVGDYECNAKDAKVEVKLTSIVELDKEDHGSESQFGAGQTVATVVTVVIITLLGVGLCTELIRRRNRHGLSDNDIKLFHKGVPEETIQNKQGYAHENAMLMPYDFSYELNEDKLIIFKDEVLGSGAFGIVVRGLYEGQKVAIKTVKPGADKSYLKALLTELKIMIYIGNNPYIAQIIGACSKDLGRGLIHVVVQIYPNGNLEHFLRERRYSFINQFNREGDLIVQNCHHSEELCTSDLIIWSYQIAEGMDFLGSRKVIHGDLAARNVLLDSNKTVKITDFGLARQLYDYSNYVKRNQEPLPWRWLSIESLKYLTFSPKSDIWSYGVLLFELFSCGDVPYPNYSWTTEFVEKLENGLRLPKPKYCSNFIYKEIMLNCFKNNPDERIEFSKIAPYFNKFALESGIGPESSL